MLRSQAPKTSTRSAARPSAYQVIFICKVSIIDYPAFVMLRALSKKYKAVARCLQNIHSFHRCYKRNCKVTAEQEAHVMGTMEIFGNAW